MSVPAMRVRQEVDVSKHVEPAAALMRAIAAGPPNTWVVYARGWYLERTAVAAAAWALFERGEVELVQRRLRSGRFPKFEYLAVKKDAPAQWWQPAG